MSISQPFRRELIAYEAEKMITDCPERGLLVLIRSSTILVGLSTSSGSRISSSVLRHVRWLGRQEIQQAEMRESSRADYNAEQVAGGWFSLPALLVRAYVASLFPKR
jgi:hypothetical protein